MVTLTWLDSAQKTSLQQWHFQSKSVIRIGRAPDNDVVLKDPLVSRHHLELRLVSFSEHQSSWQMVNLGTNGTFLDGILVSQCLIPEGSLLQLARGGPILKFEIQGAAESLSGGLLRSELSKRGTKDKGAGKSGKGNNSYFPLSSSPPLPQACTHSGNPPNNLFCIHCGQPIAVQRTIRQYQVLRTLGQGGMGTTYLAWAPFATLPGHPQLLVLKEMNADMAKVAKAQELFEREARALKSLHHPGIPKYYDFFVEAGKKYLAMELVHGQDLEKRVFDTGPVTQKQAIAWMVQTCEVLDYIHSQKPPLIHRDIKPANLMVRTSDKRVVVLDFGAVKEIGTALGTRIGAEGFCSPEQDRGQAVTQSDLYAIGPTLIFLLTGETPLKFYRLQKGGYCFQLDGVPTITPQLRTVIERVTKPRPSDRYATAKELALAIEACN